MNLQICILVLAAAAWVPCSFAGADADAGSVVVARLYSEAFVTGDCATMERLTANPVRENLGGAEKLRQFLCDFLKHLRDDQAQLSEEILGPIGSFADGDTRLVLVQKRRISVRPDRRQISKHPYVVHSNDGGATWRVLDLACADEKWMAKLAPTWTGEPPLPRMEFSVIRNGDS